MGYEVKCRARVVDKDNAREAYGTVLLETDELVVRGDARVRIKRTEKLVRPLASRRSVTPVKSNGARASK